MSLFPDCGTSCNLFLLTLGSSKSVTKELESIAGLGLPAGKSLDVVSASKVETINPISTLLQRFVALASLNLLRNLPIFRNVHHCFDHAACVAGSGT